MLFRYPQFLLGKKKLKNKNQGYYSDILCSNVTLIETAVLISFVSTRPKTKPTIQISSISAWQKSGQLFRYLLLLLDTHWDSYSNIIRFHLAEVHARYKEKKLNKDCYSDILCYYLTLIGTAIQIYSLTTRSKPKPTIHISSVSTWQNSGLLFRYPLLLLDTLRDCYLDILHFHLAKVQAYYSNSNFFYLGKKIIIIRTVVEVSSVPIQH